MTACIYKATNQVNGKSYVGKAVDFIVRRKCHRLSAENGSRCAFHCAIRKYGWESFAWEILVEDERPYVINRLEKFYIKTLETKLPNGYNMTDGGEGVCGLSLTKESRAKIRTTLTGRKHTQKTLDKMKKQRADPVFRAIQSANQQGKKHTEETRAKMRESHKGKKRSPESVAKSNAAHKGSKATEETRAKMRESHRKWWEKRREQLALLSPSEGAPW
jgi:group I intron endonuclease